MAGTHLAGLLLERYPEIRTGTYRWYAGREEEHFSSDFCLFIRVALDKLGKLGKVEPHLLSYGAFYNKNGYFAVTPGNYLKSVQIPGAYFDGKTLQPFNHEWLAESLRDNKSPPVRLSGRNEAVEVKYGNRRMLIKGKYKQQHNRLHPSLFANVYAEKRHPVFTGYWRACTKLVC